MKTRKAVILAGGIGSRMQKSPPGAAALSREAAQMADRGLKGLIPVHGRPFLDYVVGSLLEAGLTKLCLVVPPDCELLTDYARRVSGLSGAEIACAVQPRPLGTADALLAAREFAGADPFVMCNCDNLYPADAVERLARISERCCCAVGFDRDGLLRESNFGPERLRRFAVLIADADGSLQDIVEKPPDPERYVRDGKLWLSLNLFRFTPEIFDACREIPPNPERGELELTDAVSLLLDRPGTPFRVIFAGGGVLDLTARLDVASGERLLGDRSPGF